MLQYVIAFLANIIILAKRVAIEKTNDYSRKILDRLDDTVFIWVQLTSKTAKSWVLQLPNGEQGTVGQLMLVSLPE